MKIVAGILQSLLVTILVGPLLSIGILSLSPSKGMDFFVHPDQASLQWWIALYADASWGRAAATSVSVAILSSIVALVLVAPVVVYSRLSGRRFSSMLLALSGASFFIPPVVLAVCLYNLIQDAGLFDTAIGLSLAHLSVTIPVFGFILAERLKNSSKSGYLVARALGAAPLSASVTWLAAYHRPSLIAAFAAAFMGSMAEATIIFFVTDTHVLTIAKRVMSGISQDVDPSGYAAMVVWLGLILVPAMFFVRTNPQI